MKDKTVGGGFGSMGIYFYGRYFPLYYRFREVCFYGTSVTMDDDDCDYIRVQIELRLSELKKRRQQHGFSQ